MKWQLQDGVRRTLRHALNNYIHPRRVVLGGIVGLFGLFVVILSAAASGATSFERLAGGVWGAAVALAGLALVHASRKRKRPRSAQLLRHRVDRQQGLLQNDGAMFDRWLDG